jgi:hypothetical protein
MGHAVFVEDEDNFYVRESHYFKELRKCYSHGAELLYRKRAVFSLCFEWL